MDKQIDSKSTECVLAGLAIDGMLCNHFVQEMQSITLCKSLSITRAHRNIYYVMYLGDTPLDFLA